MTFIRTLFEANDTPKMDAPATLVHAAAAEAQPNLKTPTSTLTSNEPEAAHYQLRDMDIESPRMPSMKNALEGYPLRVGIGHA